MSKRNENRKGYKRTPLGWIPEEWRSIPFGEVVTKAQYGLSEATSSDGVYKIIGMRNIQDGKLNLENCTSVNISAEEFNKYKLCKGDFLFNRTNSYDLVGKSVLISKPIDAVFASYLVRFKLDAKNVVPEYLYYYFNSNKAEKRLKAIATKAVSQANINPTILQEVFEIPIATFPEQQKIAAILNTWDEAIVQTQQLLVQLKLRNRGLMQGLLTGKRRLKGFKTKWNRKALKNYLIKCDEKTSSSNQYPVLTSSRNGLFLQKDYYNGREVASLDNTGYNVVPRGFFTYRHMSDDLVFKFNINNLVDKGIVSTLYPVFNTTKELDPYYLQYVLNEGREFKHFALEQKQGGSRTYMYFSKLIELKIPIPDIEEQLAIRNVLDTYAEEVALYERKISVYQLQKKGLMQKLLTGEVRVKV